MILGADNNGQIVGINPTKVQSQLDLAKDMNNLQLFRPTYYLISEPMEIDGEQIIYFYVPESGQAHSYKGIYYDCNQDGNFELRSTEQIYLFIRKNKMRTENRVYPAIGLQDLEEEAFEALRKGIRVNNPDHPWVAALDE